ncbi:hypothetical protein MGG_15897 [Pyricularia oryzae 70-15]|uniref:Uncharacterized protein n=3 Tax=Pyricularia oryzae TaxID=318829 RepID=G4MUX5_PYRO7|nr:uncharacterized protein MGG_15897 [Pyricularia oryzae 70-15]EHA55709.1 hypothetical protein MGG_15897 [Pyricularia oryzae 70-15]ELQ37375.1 hypothetical protein OOU_Y34scaffold00597g1 [Pyricularia oryzae Y34]
MFALGRYLRCLHTSRLHGMKWFAKHHCQEREVAPQGSSQAPQCGAKEAVVTLLCAIVWSCHALQVLGLCGSGKE